LKELISWFEDEQLVRTRWRVLWLTDVLGLVSWWTTSSIIIKSGVVNGGMKLTERWKEAGMKKMKLWEN